MRGHDAAVIAVDLFGKFGVKGYYVNIEGQNISTITLRGLKYGDEYYGTFARSFYTLFQVCHLRLRWRTLHPSPLRLPLPAPPTPSAHLDSPRRSPTGQGAGPLVLPWGWGQTLGPLVSPLGGGGWHASARLAQPRLASPHLD